MRTTALRTRESPTSIIRAVLVHAGATHICGKNSPDGGDQPPRVELITAVSIVSVGAEGDKPTIVDFLAVPLALLLCRIRNSVVRVLSNVAAGCKENGIEALLKTKLPATTARIEVRLIEHVDLSTRKAVVAHREHVKRNEDPIFVEP